MQISLIKVPSDKTMKIFVDGLFQKEAKAPSFHKSKIMKCCHDTLKESPSFCLIADIKLVLLFFYLLFGLSIANFLPPLRGQFHSSNITHWISTSIVNLKVTGSLAIRSGPEAWSNGNSNILTEPTQPITLFLCYHQMHWLKNALKNFNQLITRDFLTIFIYFSKDQNIFTLW